MVGNFGLGLMSDTAPPAISGATISPSSINQSQSVTIEWDATNMTSTDISYVEFVGKGLIRRASTTDYTSYSVTISGEDLPLMEDNVIKIVAANAGGYGSDSSLTLTVIATPSSLSYFKREELVIIDVPDLVRQLFIDDLRNHLLKHIVSHDKITTNHQGTWQELPAIYIHEMESIPISTNEAIPGGVGDTWSSTIQIDLITSDDSYCNYPPPEAGELDTDDTKYDGAEKVLNVIKEIVKATLAESREGYTSDSISDFQWDNNELQGSNLVEGGYDGVSDIWAIEMTYRFNLEVVTRDG